MSKIMIKGMSWSHTRGTAPMYATSNIYSTQHPDVTFTWDERSLQDFESQPLRELAETYDLIVIDHPHVGEAVAQGLLADFNKTPYIQQLQHIAQNAVGKSHESYCIDGGQYALAIDTACPVACYRPDMLDCVPTDWQQVLDVAQTGKVAIPLRSPHALMLFFWIANAYQLPIAPNTDIFMAKSHMAQVLDTCKDISTYLDDSCYISDPIAILNTMAQDESCIAYCPHIYGYINYAHQGFRDNVILFDDIVPLNNKVGGSVLGGTGIAISALSKHQDIAIDYAIQIASTPCQTQHWVQNGGQPGHKMAWTDATCNRLSNNFMTHTLKTLENAWLRPRYNGYLSFQANGSDIICDFLQQKADKDTTIHNLQYLYQTSLAP